MASSVKQRLQVENVRPNIGASIVSDREELLSGEHAGEIRALLEQRGVLVFPQIGLSDEEQIAFTHTLGTFAHDGAMNGGKPGVYPITMASSVNSRASYLQGAFYWHIDGTMSRTPILASIMSARALAAEGGETEFCNTYAAWDALPEDDKRALDGLKVTHAVWRSQLYWEPEPSHEQFTQWQSRGQNTLPLVWTHRSGRKSLVLGATALQIEGMGLAESEALLIRLRDWATQPQFVYQHS